MIPIIRQELSRCLKLKCSDIRILENVSRHKLNKTLYGKSFRITPIRFSQSKTNNDKTDSFTYNPGMSPADFKNSGQGPKKPWYKQMSGAKGQMGKIHFIYQTIFIIIHKDEFSSLIDDFLNPMQYQIPSND